MERVDERRRVAPESVQEDDDPIVPPFGPVSTSTNPGRDCAAEPDGENTRGQRSKSRSHRMSGVTMP
jgi:hypothetical protein